MSEKIAELTQLQREVGYEPGLLNLIALIGMAGEAGEVLEEVKFDLLKGAGIADELFVQSIKNFIIAAGQLNSWKKDIRDGRYQPKIEWYSDNKFVKELADLFYYFNALAVTRNVSIDEIAEIVVNKVKTLNLKKNISHANQS